MNQTYRMNQTCLKSQMSRLYLSYLMSQTYLSYLKSQTCLKSQMNQMFLSYLKNQMCLKNQTNLKFRLNRLLDSKLNRPIGELDHRLYSLIDLRIHQCLIQQHLYLI